VRIGDDGVCGGAVGAKVDHGRHEPGGVGARADAADGGAGKASFYYSGGWVTGQSIVTDGHWHHLAAVYRREGGCRLYVDGRCEATGDSVPMIAPEVPLLIGGIQVGDQPTGTLSGSVDELAIYDVALSAPEVAVLAAPWVRPPGAAQTPVGSLRPIAENKPEGPPDCGGVLDTPTLSDPSRAGSGSLSHARVLSPPPAQRQPAATCVGRAPPSVGGRPRDEGRPRVPMVGVDPTSVLGGGSRGG